MFFKNKKAFVSIISILLLSIFIISLIKNSNIKNTFIDYKDISIVSYLDLEKENNILNINKIIEINLNNEIDNPLILKESINVNLINYFKSKNNFFYIQNVNTKKEELVNLSKLDNITKVIVYKANDNLLVKRYIITNSINKNLYLKLKIKHNNLELSYLFPKNYTVEKYVCIN
jgi:hypothetical protein